MKNEFLKNFLKVNVKRTIAVGVITATAAAVTLAAASDVMKTSDPLPAPGASQHYLDDSAGKVKEREIPDFIGTENKKATYEFTENNSFLTVKDRADKYGTYDVYIDKSGAEYLFLYDSDLLCGYINMPKINAVSTGDNKKISQDDAVAAAEEFIKKSREDHGEYKYVSCRYNEAGGYYDIKYQLPISGYKSDDIFRIWISKDGETVSFSQFNYGRYKNDSVSADRYERARQALDKAVSDTGLEVVEDEMNDEFISKNDKGKLVLKRNVAMGLPGSGSSSVTGMEFEQVI